MSGQLVVVPPFFFVSARSSTIRQPQHRSQSCYLKSGGFKQPLPPPGIAASGWKWSSMFAKKSNNRL